MEIKITADALDGEGGRPNVVQIEPRTPSAWPWTLARSRVAYKAQGEAPPWEGLWERAANSDV